MQLANEQWRCDRARPSTRTVLDRALVIDAAPARSETLEWVVSNTGSIDEVVLAMWIIDRCFHPHHWALREAAVVIAYKMHGTCPHKISLQKTVRHQRFRSTRVQLRLNEMYVCTQLNWNFLNVVAQDHIRGVLKAFGGNLTARRYTKQCILDVIRRSPRAPLPEFAIAVCIDAMHMARQRDHVLRMVRILRFHPIRLDIVRCIVMSKHEL